MFKTIPNNKVKDRLSDIIKKKIILQNGYTLKKNITYLIKLNEELRIPKKYFL